jgi:hypothetical protein
MVCIWLVTGMQFGLYLSSTLKKSATYTGQLQIKGTLSGCEFVNTLALQDAQMFACKICMLVTVLASQALIDIRGSLCFAHCSLLHCYCNRSQQLYADTLVHYIEAQQASDCTAAAAHISTNENYWTPVAQTAADAPLMGRATIELEALTCHGHTPRSTFDAADTATFNSTITFTITAGTAVSETTAVQHEDWNIRADRKDKPGYIASGVSHSILTARMQCSMRNSKSKHVMIAVTYLKSYAGVGAVHIYGTRQHPAQRGPPLHLRGSHRDGQAANGAVVNGRISDYSSHHVIDALDTTEHVSPYHTKYLKLDHTYFAESDGTAAGTQSLEISFDLLNAADVPLINSIKAAAAASKGDSNASTSDDSDYSDAIRQDWKFKLVRLSCC